MFTVEEKERIVKQVCEFWGKDLATREDTKLLAVRFDNLTDPRKLYMGLTDYMDSICIVSYSKGAYLFKWSPLDVLEDGSLHFTRKRWSKWLYSTQEVDRLTEEDYKDIMMWEDKSYPEFQTVFIKPEYDVMLTAK